MVFNGNKAQAGSFNAVVGKGNRDSGSDLNLVAVTCHIYGEGNALGDAFEGEIAGYFNGAGFTGGGGFAQVYGLGDA